MDASTSSVCRYPCITVLLLVMGILWGCQSEPEGAEPPQAVVDTTEVRPDPVEAPPETTAASPEPAEGERDTALAGGRFPDTTYPMRLPSAFPDGFPDTLAGGPGEAPREEDEEDLLSAVDEYLDDHLGNIVFNTPREMGHRESRVIHLLLSPKLSVDELTEELGKSVPPAEGGTESARVSITNRMQATLKGSSFEITKITDEVQGVSYEGTTRWQWEIRPRQSGTHSLFLTLSALLEVDGEPTPHVIDVYSRKINVRVGLGEQVAGFVGDHWRWLAGTIIIPLFGWYWRSRRSKTTSAEGGSG